MVEGKQSFGAFEILNDILKGFEAASGAFRGCGRVIRGFFITLRCLWVTVGSCLRLCFAGPLGSGLGGTRGSEGGQGEGKKAQETGGEGEEQQTVGKFHGRSEVKGHRQDSRPKIVQPRSMLMWSVVG